MKNILITHCLPDDNPGGLAILWGMMKALKSSFPDCQCNLLSLYSSKDSRSKTAYRHITKAYPELKIFGSLLKHRTEFDKTWTGKLGRAYKAIAWPTDLLRSLLGLIWPALLKNTNSVNAFRESDIILSRGSHIVFDNPKLPIRSAIGIYTLVYPLLLAKRLSKKYVMYAHSISALHVNINRQLFRYTMKNCHKILIREKLSRNILIDYYKIDKDKILLVPDAAFAFDTPNEATKKEIIKRWSLPYQDFIAVTVVRWVIAPEKTEACLNGMAETIDWLIDNGHVSKCALVLQVRRGPANWEDDREITEDLYRRIKNSGKVSIIEDDWIPEVLIAIYGAAKLTMVTRFHSLMFSLIGGTPPLAIAFSGPKSRGVMEWMGLEEYVLDQSNFSVDGAQKKLSEIISTYAELEQQVRESVEKKRRAAYQSPELL